MTLRVGVLISGQGTNLQAILDAQDRYSVVLVISNQEEAYGLVRAQKAGIPTVVVSHKRSANREAFEEELIRNLDSHQVGLVVLAGFMRVLTKKLVEHYRGRIMNIHPALLPAFPGTDAVRKAWERGVRVTGVTVHFVEENVDAGPIILQEAVPIMENEGLETLTKKIHEVEHRLYPRAIRLFAQGRFQIEGERVKIVGEGP